MPQTRYANRWACKAQPFGTPGHLSGTGPVPRRYCECGSRVFTERGMWGVFKADADGKPDGPPLHIRKYQTAADRNAAAGNTGQPGTLTVAWIPEEDL